MTSQEAFERVYVRVSALTQQIMLDWLITPLTFSEMVESYSQQDIATVLEELRACNALVWTNGLPEFDLTGVA